MNELLTGEDRNVLSFSKGLTAWWKKSGVYLGIAVRY